jgi:hypothetical protein
MTNNTSPRLTRQREKAKLAIDEALSGPSIGISLDVRKLAGFEPALVVEVRIPSKEQEIALCESFFMTVAGERGPTTPLRSELWVLTPGTRSPTPLVNPQLFSSQSHSADSLYKMFFVLPREGEWQFETPRMQSLDYELASQKISGQSSGGRATVSNAV